MLHGGDSPVAEFWRGTGHRRRCNCRRISLVGFWKSKLHGSDLRVGLVVEDVVDADVLRREQNERRALRVVGVCFCSGRLHRLRVCYGSTSKRAPNTACGNVLACVSLDVMPHLLRAKRKMGAPGQAPASGGIDVHLSIGIRLPAALPRAAPLFAWPRE